MLIRTVGVKKAVVCGLANLAVLCVGLSASDAQIVLYSESFEYADQAALEAAWPFGLGFGCCLSDTVQLNPGLATDGSNSVATYGDHGSRKADLGLMGTRVWKFSYDVYLDSANGINASSNFEIWEDIPQADYTGFAGSISTPNYASGNYELHFSDSDYADPNFTRIPLGISLVDGQWNNIEMTIDPNGTARSFSVNGNVSGVIDSDYGPFINSLGIFDLSPLTTGGPGGASVLDNIVLLGRLPGELGDFNADDAVDLIDFGILSDNLQGHLEGPVGDGQGDSDFDGDVDLDDFQKFKAAFPAVVAAAAALGVPEPSSVSLWASALAGVALLVGRSHITSHVK